MTEALIAGGAENRVLRKTLSEQLSKVSLRPTLNRLEILHLLFNAKQPLLVSDIHRILAEQASRPTCRRATASSPSWTRST